MKGLDGLTMTVTWSVKHLHGGKILAFETSGLYLPADSARLVAEILATKLDEDTLGILVDHRASEVRFETVDIYNRPKLYGGTDLFAKVRVAVLFRKVGPDEQFYETVCRNSGYGIRVFEDYDQAVGWLLEAEKDRRPWTGRA